MRLGRGVHRLAADRPDQNRPDRSQDEIQRHGRNGEVQPQGHQTAHDHREQREERPRAVGDLAGVPIARQRQRVTIHGDPAIPLGIPQPQDVADPGIEVTDPRGGLEPRRGHPHGEDREEPGRGIHNEDGADGVSQRPPEELVATCSRMERARPSGRCHVLIPLTRPGVGRGSGRTGDAPPRH